MKRILLLAIALSMAACLPGGGTEDTNDLQVSGTLVDKDGRPSPGALVILSSKGLGSAPALTGRPDAGQKYGTRIRIPEPESTLTDRQGYYAFRDVAPGRYDLRIYAHASGGPEREVARRNVELEAGESLELPPASTELALGWVHRARLVLEAPDSGEGLVTDFPLLVRLSGASFPKDAQGGGRDIRFAKPDGSHLPHEIERWDSVSGRAEIWVRMDTVRTVQAGTDTGAPALWMYWGNPTVADASAGAEVYDSAAGYAGIWHMHQDPAGAPPQMQDASAARNHGTAQGSAPQAGGEAAVGQGITFNGTDQYVSTVDRQSDPDVFTLSLWFQATVTGGKIAGFESNAVGQSTYFDRHLWLDSAGHLRFGVFSPAPSVITAADSPYVRNVLLPGENPDRPDIERILVSPGTYADGGWHQVTAMLSPEGQSLYVDGALAAADSRVTDGGAYDGYWRFGGGAMGNWVGRSDGDFYRGMIDEASVVLRARSPAWIRLAYLTQVPGAARLRTDLEY